MLRLNLRWTNYFIILSLFSCKGQLVTTYHVFFQACKLIVHVAVPRQSLLVESSVTELVSMLKEPLRPEELARMMPEDNQNNEPDAYTTLLNTFTQRNTEALVKCESSDVMNSNEYYSIVVSDAIRPFTFLQSNTTIYQQYVMCKVFNLPSQITIYFDRHYYLMR